MVPKVELCHMSLIKSLFMGSIVGARWRGHRQLILLAQPGVLKVSNKVLFTVPQEMCRRSTGATDCLPPIGWTFLMFSLFTALRQRQLGIGRCDEALRSPMERRCIPQWGCRTLKTPWSRRRRRGNSGGRCRPESVFGQVPGTPSGWTVLTCFGNDRRRTSPSFTQAAQYPGGFTFGLLSSLAVVHGTGDWRGIVGRRRLWAISCGPSRLGLCPSFRVAENPFCGCGEADIL